jgi:hypothetical protein
MPAWLWLLIVVLALIALVGAVGYRQRGRSRSLETRRPPTT